MEGGVIIKEDWLRGNSLFEGIEGISLWCFPLPHAILDHEVEEWTFVVREVLDEPLVEVGEA